MSPFKFLRAAIICESFSYVELEMQMNIIPIKRALLSVSDKTNIIEFAKELVDLGIEIISTGGTSKKLSEANIAHQQVEDITDMPEVMDGRLKTLHPRIHGGILGRRDEHASEAIIHGINWIDLVVVNFYPFSQVIERAGGVNGLSWEEAIEYIDIGGPTMARAAAKNFAWVGVIVDPNDYSEIITELRNQNGLSPETRKNLAEKVFALTSSYDAMIHRYFLQKDGLNHSQPQQLNLLLEKKSELRYGENPHQKAFAYQFKEEKSGILSAHQYQGKPLSYNNILDTEAALACVREFDMPTCVIVKHANPCGVASAEMIHAAYQSAYQADPTSAFGGIVALNRPCTKETAEAISGIFTEVVLAPAYTEEALAIFATKPNLRVLELEVQKADGWEMKFITGGVLVQEKDLQIISSADLKFVTQRKPKPQDVEAMLFAWKVLKHIKSNAILIAKDHTTIGIGAGQVSRIDSVEIALRKAGEKIKDTILASDAFFPFRDSIDRIAKTGVRAVIQPGGSVRDEEVIAACDEHGIAMAFTGKRCFKH